MTAKQAIQRQSPCLLVLAPARNLWKSSKVEIRPMMMVALTYDHRLIDGREGVTFLRKIKAAVEDPTIILLDLWVQSYVAHISSLFPAVSETVYNGGFIGMRRCSFRDALVNCLVVVWCVICHRWSLFSPHRWVFIALAVTWFDDFFRTIGYRRGFYDDCSDWSSLWETLGLLYPGHLDSSIVAL